MSNDTANDTANDNVGVITINFTINSPDGAVYNFQASHKLPPTYDIGRIAVLLQRFPLLFVYDPRDQPAAQTSGTPDATAAADTHDDDTFQSIGADVIAAERRRQVEIERFTFAHDDQYTNSELICAALAYASHDLTWLAGQRGESLWPFASKWWKPSSDPLDNLCKAGALIAAEIDRLVRFRTATSSTKKVPVWR